MATALISAEDLEGRNPPVVLVSALGDPASYWKQVISKLSGGSRVISFDRPGIGASPPRPAPNPPLTYHRFAAELAALLDHLGVTVPAVLVGHSAGSLIIRVFAGAYPGRVGGMVYVDGSVPRLLFRPGAKPAVDGVGARATRVDAARGEAEVNDARLPRVPSIVLARTPGNWYGPAPDPQIDGLWQQAQADLADQSASPLIIAKDSGHRMPDDAPGLVAFAIDQVVSAARDHSESVALDPHQVSDAGGELADRAVR
jgi:pimeloyl-ACP methyl ester carboxylesterase